MTQREMLLQLVRWGFVPAHLRTARSLARRGELEVDVAIERLLVRHGLVQPQRGVCEQLRVWLTMGDRASY